MVFMQYPVNFSFYQGKSPNPNTVYETQFGKATAPLVQMIDDLTQDVKLLPFHFFFDNLFTGFSVLSYVREKGYGATGTIRENRVCKLCPTSSKKVLVKKERGYFESSLCKDDGVIVTKWVDNSVFTLASTCEGVEPVSFVKRYSAKEKKTVQVQGPQIITAYNKHMGGVDRMDENIAMCRINIRNKKWYWALHSWLIDVSVHNAWQLKKGTGARTTQPEFRREIVQVYLKRYTNPVNGAGSPSISPMCGYKSHVPSDIRYDGIKHYIKKTEKKRRCVRLYCKQKSSAVRSKCGKCDVGLCLECFEVYHESQ
ncbi:piggyBac transposable element-derived protein 3-like [Schistocerca serialis cubense]|uniref:piggyBac transposable element-derived protein 3-like n=1 Tax=Schistocerca serialis cubense TaxID=2023355 RepID=UPI00214F5D7E|nr:piggyBac transposable element-derived protein 3-like [Schistocerca serialis cubense]